MLTALDSIQIILVTIIDSLSAILTVLDALSLNIGNVSISIYDAIRVLVLGVLLFWLGKVASQFGKKTIKKQTKLDLPTQEIFVKLFEVSLFVILSLLLLNIMGINLTTLAVFSGAVGVGIGLGLQSIASNFISGIIILLDRSITIGDYVELSSIGLIRILNNAIESIFPLRTTPTSEV